MREAWEAWLPRSERVLMLYVYEYTHVCIYINIFVFRSDGCPSQSDVCPSFVIKWMVVRRLIIKCISPCHILVGYVLVGSNICIEICALGDSMSRWREVCCLLV